MLDGPCKIENIPDVADINVLLEIIKALGAEIRHDAEGSLYIDPQPIHTYVAEHERVRSIADPTIYWGAMLGRLAALDFDARRL